MKRTRVLLLALLVLFTAAGASAQLLMRGDINYATYGSRVRIDVEEIANFEAEKTDRVRFRLWASEHRWTEFRRGHLIAVAPLPRIGPHETLDDVHRRVHLNRPPSGWYYVTLVLEERVVDETGARWEIRDVVEFDDQQYFRRNWPFPF